MWQWHLWAGPGGPGVWVSTGALVGQGDPRWPPWPGSGLAGSGLGPGPMSRWSPLWAALSDSGCCSTKSPVRPPVGPVAARRPGCRKPQQSCADAGPDPPVGHLRDSAGHIGLFWATIFASGCPGHLFLEAPKSCGDKAESSPHCPGNGSSKTYGDVVNTCNQITQTTKNRLEKSKIVVSTDRKESYKINVSPTNFNQTAVCGAQRRGKHT